jgi:LacI family transcriptional regulator
MRTGRTRTLGLVLPDLTNPFFPELAQAVENKARSLGLVVCLIDSQSSLHSESDGFSLLLQHAVDGIIWCPLGPRLPASLKKLTGPMVLIDRPRPGYAAVHSNYEMGGRLLAEYALRMGHTRIGLLSGPQQLESARQRRDGFANAFPEDIQIAWEVSVSFDGVLTAQAIDALERGRKATLIVAGNDLIAISAMRCLSNLGVAVPDEVSVTGFDNIRWTDLVTPRLTTIAQPVGAIGARAVEMLMERIEGQNVAPARTVFDVELIERDSVKPRRAK